MIQIGLGGWLTCRIWDGMRSLGTVWRIGRSPMKYSMEHSVSRTVVVSECSPPPMCGLGRSGDSRQPHNSGLDQDWIRIGSDTGSRHIKPAW